MKASKIIFLAMPLTLALTACSSDGVTLLPIPQRLVQTNAVISDGSELIIDYEYGTNGNLQTATNRVNGVVDRISEYESLPNGLLANQIVDDNADGVPDMLLSFHYENEGLSRINYYDLLQQAYVAANVYSYENGVIVTRERYEFDAVPSLELIDLANATLRTIQTFNYENDRISTRNYMDGNGVLRSTRSFAFNMDGTLASTSTTSVDGGTLSSSTHVYDHGLCNAESNPSFDHFLCVK